MIFNRSVSASEINQLYMTNLQKYNQSQWYLYINPSLNSSTGLDTCTYTYQAHAKDEVGNWNETETRTIEVGVSVPTTTRFASKKQSWYNCVFHRLTG